MNYLILWTKLKSCYLLQVNCLESFDTPNCPQLVNLTHALVSNVMHAIATSLCFIITTQPNITANRITYMFINMNTNLLIGSPVRLLA